jgi:hypothetical protein
MAPNPNIYASLLKGTHLSYKKAKIWEERVKISTTYVKFGRRYRQMVRFLLAKDANDFTLFSNSYSREYYKLPQWQRVDGDNQPVEPNATETYRQGITFDDNHWSSSDDDGTILGYDSAGKITFCESRKSGKPVHQYQMVVPGCPELKKLGNLSDNRDHEGRIYSDFDPIKRMYMEEGDGEGCDPYLNLMIERRLERKKRRERVEEGELKRVAISKHYKANLSFCSQQEEEYETRGGR